MRKLILNQTNKRIEKFFKVRKIRISQLSNRGTIFSQKNLYEGYVEFESLLEEGIFLLLDHDPHCIDFESQPTKVNDVKNGLTYIPDVWAKFKDGRQVIYDIKHQSELDEIQSDPERYKKWEQRIILIEDFCEKNGLVYDVVTENEIWRERFYNVEFYRKDRRVPRLLTQVKPEIINILKEKEEITRNNLAIELSERLEIDEREAISNIDHLIYFDFFLLDFNTKIGNDTILQLKLWKNTVVPPLYLYIAYMKKTSKQSKSPVYTPDLKDPKATPQSMQEFNALPDQLQTLVLERINHLKIFNHESITTEKIKIYAKKNDISLAGLYRWKKKYNQNGWVGLIPNYQNRGRYKGLSPKAEALMKQAIDERYLTKIQPSVRGVYRFLEVLCEDLEIDPPSFSTFSRRVNETKETEKTLRRRGKKLLKDKFKSLEGEYPFGKHPLDIVEFDHTIVDIMLLDKSCRQVIGRPTLTIAIDVYSRMVYGYYLSFDSQDLLSVGMCFLTGIMPKDEITNRFETENLWEIQGLPKRILLDNAKEFRSGGLFNFCQLYDIEMIFCPPKQPDTKPHIERLIRTINEAIRDDAIGGYVQPLVEKRQTQYNPEKKSIMTLEEFEEWFVQWIVDDYHQRNHRGLQESEGLEISSSEKYKQGLEESEGKAIGLPKIAINLDQLRFDVLPHATRKLHRDGIKIFGLKYNSSVISKLRADPELINEKFIVKYDPRDIREVYLWVQKLKKFFPIPLRNVGLSHLIINPDDPMDYPMSLKEFEIIKQEIGKGTSINQQKIVKARKRRLKLIENSEGKTKREKKRRKQQEKLHLHKKQATSTKSRKRKKEDNKEILEEQEEEEEYTPNILLSEEALVEDEEDEEYVPEILPTFSFDKDTTTLEEGKDD